VETRRWQAALKADTVGGYRRFIADFPESVYSALAKTQLGILDEKAWQKLSAEDNIPAYEDYLDFFPLGIHQAEALRRIDSIKQAEAKRERQRLEQERLEMLAWEQASGTRSIASFDQYIADWPAGLHIEEARRVRRLLQDQSDDDKAFQTALKLNTREAFQAYIDAFAQGVNVTSALQHIDDLTLRPGKSFKDCEDCPGMIVVPAGAYWQGSNDNSKLALNIEKPRRLVTIDEPFAVSIHEVTMAEWDTCYDDKACMSYPTDNGWGRADRPVIMVSWNDAGQYLHWLSEKSGQSYRLPSESEWEYFARAGENSDWPGGDPAKVCQYANVAGAETGFRWQHPQCEDDMALGTAKVGSFMPNSFGLYDTTGNVSEWTADCMNLSYIDAPVDGSAWGRGLCSSHMTRGGSWITGSKEIRLPARFNLKNGDRNDFTGFRVVRKIED
jgi:formylglycine-generating enzyme required for sulfatase activity